MKFKGMEDNAKKRFEELRKSIEKYLDLYMDVFYPEKIYESMRYSVLAGGKRLRPVMALEVASLFGVSLECAMPSACAIEMLHSQSLIHDDLPAMDNDDFRRGKPSNHKTYGEATAILAGDALLSYAPKLIIDKTPSEINSDILLKVLREFFIAAGVDGIISGQIVDLDSEKKKISKETLEYLYEYKTAKLFELAVRTGALLGNASPRELNALTEFAKTYGYAFQIYDDILDVTSTLDELGKTPGKDAVEGKSTYVSMFGLEEAEKQTLFLCNKAYDILNSNGINSPVLNGIISDILNGTRKIKGI